MSNQEIGTYLSDMQLEIDKLEKDILLIRDLKDEDLIAAIAKGTFKAKVIKLYNLRKGLETTKKAIKAFDI